MNPGPERPREDPFEAARQVGEVVEGREDNLYRPSLALGAQIHVEAVQA